MFDDMLSDSVLLIEPLIEYLLRYFVLFKSLLIPPNFKFVQVERGYPSQVGLGVVKDVVPRDLSMLYRLLGRNHLAILVKVMTFIRIELVRVRECKGRV
jgi:hypothetical protein